jgi:hypothetical protein
MLRCKNTKWNIEEYGVKAEAEFDWFRTDFNSWLYEHVAECYLKRKPLKALCLLSHCKSVTCLV